MKILIILAGVIILAGCGNKAAENMPEASMPESAGEDNGWIISSIKDAMRMGRTMKCAYKTAGKEGQIEATTYVDGKKYMTEMAIGNDTQKMVFDGEAMYSWTEGQKKGMKMTLACTEELAKNVPQSDNQNAPMPDPAGEKSFEDALDVNCVPASGADFSIPADVTFTDQCEMLKGLMNKIPNLKGNIPQELPSGMPNLTITTE